MAGLNSRTPGSPTSLVNGDNAAGRRAVKGAVAVNGVPTSTTHGYPTKCHRYLHIELKLVGGTSVDWRLWTRRPGMSGEWCLDTRPGTAGTVTTTTASSPENSIIEIDGSDEVYVQLLNFVGPPTVDVWLGSCGEL